MEKVHLNELEEAARKMTLYAFLDRALTADELWERLPPKKRPEHKRGLYDILERLEEAGFLKREGNHLIVRRGDEEKIVEGTLRKNRIVKEKWQTVLRHRALFACIPFIDFVLVSGSLTLGSAEDHSDFDVVVGCATGKIFTVRFLTAAVFGALGIRRRDKDTKKDARDKFCFNHFVTPHGYRLMGPYTAVWHETYQRLVPLYGDEEKVIAFFKANDWAERRMIVFDNRFLPKTGNRARAALEKLLGRSGNDSVERMLKYLQLARINRKRSKRNGVRIYCSDEELEFHPREPEFRELAERVEKHAASFAHFL